MTQASVYIGRVAVARAKFDVDLEPLKNLEQRFKDPALRADLMRIAGRAEVSALVAQAIADNFAKEGPGWRPLKGATIRNSVALNAVTKRLLKDAKLDAAFKIGAVRKSKSGKYSIDRRELKGRMGEYNKHVDAFIEGVEAAARTVPDDGVSARGNRQILRRTSLLYQTVTTVGFSGSVGPSPKNPGIRPMSGRNIRRTENSTLVFGTNLIYAGVHNNDERAIPSIPQRKFLVLHKEWQLRLNRYVKKLMTDLVRNAVEGRK